MRRELQGLREAARLSRRQPAYWAFAYPTLVGQIELGHLASPPESVVSIRLATAPRPGQ